MLGKGWGLDADAVRPQARWMALIAHFVSMAAGLLLLLKLDWHHWFFGDDWEFIVGRGIVNGAVHGLWYPHNEHWSTLPILVYRALFSVFGVRTYVPYLLVLLVAHLILAHLIWLTAIESGANIWIATLLASAFVVLGAGFENLVWAFQLGFVASVTFGYLALRTVNPAGDFFSRRNVVGWCFAVAALMCSGIGVTMIVVVTGAMLLRDGIRPAVRFAVVPAGVYLIWFLLAGRYGLRGDQQSATTILDLPRYLWTGLSSAYERAFGMSGSGPLLVLALFVWVLHRCRQLASSAPSALALLAGTLFLMVVVGLGRSSLGVQQATATRYAYLVMALSLPAIALALTDLSQQRAEGIVIIAALVIVIIVSNVGELRLRANDWANRGTVLERQILAAAQLVQSGDPILADQPEPVYDPDITTAALRRLARNHQLPTHGVGVSRFDVLAASTYLQLALTNPTASAPSAPLPLVALARATATRLGPCVSIQPTAAGGQVVLAVSAPGGAVQLTNDVGGVFSVSLKAGDTGQIGPSRMFSLASRQPSRLQTTAGQDALIITIPDGSATVLCNVGGVP